MTTIETGDAPRRVFCDVGNGMTDSQELRVPTGPGALVIIGPSAGELPGLNTLLEMPTVESVEAIGARLANWNTASAEVIEVGRSASQIIRTGRTPVVHLDSHVGDAAALPVDQREFVCARLGQILVGVADVPAYVVTHGECMVRSLIIDSLEDCAPESVGSIGAGYPIWRLSAATMFAGTCVTMCPADRPADAIVEVLTWFEAHRS